MILKSAGFSSGTWPFGLAVTVVGAAGIHCCIALSLYRKIPGTQRDCLLLIAAIIFVTVILRQGFNESFAWATTVPPFLFLVMTWFGCSYNVSKRSHLAFIGAHEFAPPIAVGNTHLGHVALGDHELGGRCHGIAMVLNSATNFAILIGTDNGTVVVSNRRPRQLLFGSARGRRLAGRYRAYRRGDSLVNPVAIGSD